MRMGIPINHVDWDLDIYDRYESRDSPPSWVAVGGRHEPDNATRGGAGPGKRWAATGTKVHHVIYDPKISPSPTK